MTPNDQEVIHQYHPSRPMLHVLLLGLGASLLRYKVLLKLLTKPSTPSPVLADAVGRSMDPSQ